MCVVRDVCVCKARAVPDPIHVCVLCAEPGLPLASPCVCALLLPFPPFHHTALSPCLLFGGFFWQVVQPGCPSHDRSVGQAGPWACLSGRGGAGVRDHFHQPIVGLLYLRQQVWQPALVGSSVHKASHWQSSLGSFRGNSPPSLLSGQVESWLGCGAMVPAQTLVTPPYRVLP